MVDEGGADGREVAVLCGAVGGGALEACVVVHEGGRVDGAPVSVVDVGLGDLVPGEGEGGPGLGGDGGAEGAGGCLNRIDGGGTVGGVGSAIVVVVGVDAIGKPVGIRVLESLIDGSVAIVVDTVADLGRRDARRRELEGAQVDVAHHRAVGHTVAVEAADPALDVDGGSHRSQGAIDGGGAGCQVEIPAHRVDEGRIGGEVSVDPDAGRPGPVVEAFGRVVPPQEVKAERGLGGIAVGVNTAPLVAEAIALGDVVGDDDREELQPSVYVDTPAQFAQVVADRVVDRVGRGEVDVDTPAIPIRRVADDDVVRHHRRGGGAVETPDGEPTTRRSGKVVGDQVSIDDRGVKARARVHKDAGPVAVGIVQGRVGGDVVRDHVLGYDRRRVEADPDPRPIPGGVSVGRRTRRWDRGVAHDCVVGNDRLAGRHVDPRPVPGESLRVRCRQLVVGDDVVRDRG